MEALIIFVIATIISSLFKGKDGKQKPKQQGMPPFSNPAAPAKPVQPKMAAPAPRSLEDFAKEVFGQLEEKVGTNKQAVSVEAVPTPTPVEPVKKPVQQERAKRVERPLVEQLKQENAKAFDVVPTSRQALMQAVVMSEVLGPPKSRKRA